MDSISDLTPLVDSLNEEAKRRLPGNEFVVDTLNYAGKSIALTHVALSTLGGMVTDGAPTPVISSYLHQLSEKLVGVARYVAETLALLTISPETNDQTDKPTTTLN